MTLTKFSLTDTERLFIKTFFHETANAVPGPAVNWFLESGIPFYELEAIEKVAWDENPNLLIDSLDFIPGGIDIPWKSVQEFRDRAREASDFLRVGV